MSVGSVQHISLAEKVGRLEEDRDRWIRLFNRLEAAISHHKKARTPDGQPWCDGIDEALYAARDKILRDAASPRKAERP